MTKNKRPYILITNDDGIEAHGIVTLIQMLKPYGDLLVVAPDKGQSAMSHAITIKEPLILNRIKETKELSMYSCNGTSVDCVKLAINSLANRKPDFLFSGINHGTNSSVSIIYSGTMGGAIEGAINGIPSIGFSVLEYSEKPEMKVAEIYGKKIIEKFLKSEISKNICFNVNFPSFSVDEMKGVKVCRQAKAKWVEEFSHGVNPRGKDYYWLTGRFENFEPDAEDTDEWALKNSYVSIVPVKFDFTDYASITEFKNWNDEIKI